MTNKLSIGDTVYVFKPDCRVWTMVVREKLNDWSMLVSSGEDDPRLRFYDIVNEDDACVLLASDPEAQKLAAKWNKCLDKLCRLNEKVEDMAFS